MSAHRPSPPRTQRLLAAARARPGRAAVVAVAAILLWPLFTQLVTVALGRVAGLGDGPGAALLGLGLWVSIFAIGARFSSGVVERPSSETEEHDPELEAAHARLRREKERFYETGAGGVLFHWNWNSAQRRANERVAAAQRAIMEIEERRRRERSHR